MQNHDWNDLKYLLALYRTGTLRAAARSVGVSDTTVSRRITVLERAVGASLFLRSATGRFEPTDAARGAIAHAEAIEVQNTLIRETLGRAAHAVTGTVRISAVPIVVNRMLVPALGLLAARHPDLCVELVPTSDNLDLSRREADLAVRFARPASGGLRTKAQKLGALSFDIFVPNAATGDQAAQLRWITYDDAHADLPQARWLDAAARGGGRAAGLRVADAETAMEAVAHGLGKTLLPTRIARSDPRLRCAPGAAGAALPVRDIWLLSHVDQTARASVMAAKEWLVDLDWDVDERATTQP
ncbi:LysR family transcriptional regulator [uncultured Tateyamaria sp.]|uniref:LysR family transcriptional regulator n=1 Tax=Tateyamaria sp. 1078 TaxID=3417464 RepID=UPI00261B1956|nr:LysR family transcriptional regulator [uncultured Tateyamaria sp.]